MSSSDSSCAHFDFVTLLVRSLQEMPAQLLEHHYSEEAFGSWYVVVRHEGRVSRVAFDGKEKHMCISYSVDRQSPYKYGLEQTISRVEDMRRPESATIIAICEALAS